MHGCYGAHCREALHNQAQIKRKQHYTLQLGHFKHVKEELRTPIQQPSRDEANSCLPYPAKVPR